MSYASALALCLLCTGAGVPDAVLPAGSDEDRVASPRLIVTPNRVKIAQRDNLLVRVVFQNPTTSEVEVVVEPPHLDTHYFRLELRERSAWKHIYRIFDENLVGQLRPLRASFSAHSTYAEYNWIQYDKGKFHFEKPGTYELRAVATTDVGEIMSAPVSITVVERERTELGRTTGGPDFKALQYDLHKRFMDMKDLSGNSGASIRNFILVQEFARTGMVDGKHVPIEILERTLKPRMDDVSWEYGLSLLGGYYVSKQDVFCLQHVVNAMPYQSAERRFLSNHLDSFLRRPGR